MKWLRGYQLQVVLPYTQTALLILRLVLPLGTHTGNLDSSNQSKAIFC